MSAGAKNRVTAATGMNQGSSRSHSVFIISLQQVCHTLEHTLSCLGATACVEKNMSSVLSVSVERRIVRSSSVTCEVLSCVAKVGHLEDAYRALVLPRLDLEHTWRGSRLVDPPPHVPQEQHRSRFGVIVRYFPAAR